MPFRIALSGLTTSFASLRTGSNNIANSSTAGFKRSRVETSNNPDNSGAQVAAVTRQFNQGNIEFTGRPLDLAVSGQGLFRLNDNGTSVYSRNGAFHADKDGYVVNSQNQRLTGFQADSDGNITGALGDLRVDTSTIAPAATTVITLGLNIDARGSVPAGVFNPQDATTYNHATSVTVFDSLGSPQQLDLYFRQSGTPNEVEMHTYANGNPVSAPATLEFSTGGKLSSASRITLPAFNPGSGADPLQISVDVTDVTQYGSDFAIHAVNQDGYGSGKLTGVGISDNGVISASFTNGQTHTLGQVALSNFRNLQGLGQSGNSLYTETSDSGAALTGAPGSGGLGYIQSGALESANVNLAEQLIDLKAAKLQVQASAQVIRTIDDALGSLFDSKA